MAAGSPSALARHVKHLLHHSLYQNVMLAKDCCAGACSKQHFNRSGVHLSVVATDVTLSANTRMVCRAWKALARQSHMLTA